MEYLWYFLALIVWASILAKIEVQMEGRHGWAENLPTTRWKNDGGIIFKRSFGKNRWDYIANNIFLKFALKILAGRDLTAYHLYGILLQFFAGSLIVYTFLGYHELATFALRVFSFVWFIQATEDTLWFIFNPFYRLKNYRRDMIAWHKDDWWYFAPKSMIIAMLLSIIAFLLPFFF